MNAPDNWQRITPGNMPRLEVPVWLFLGGIEQPIIGCRTLIGDAWLWARCYDDYWWSPSDGGWKTSTAEEDDLHPTHWQPLPNPPTI